MSGARHWEQDKEATVYIGNLDERVSDSLVWELMLQSGRIANVHLPKDRVTQSHQGYGFVEFISEEDAEYASRIMNGIRIYGKPIRVNKASADKQKSVETGAELFVGNLDPMVTEQVLYDTFGRFGSLTSLPKIARDDNNLSKGYGFVSFSDFESSDAAIANMSGQYLMNKQVSVQYAYKKDGKGERHGDEAERMLAAQARKHNVRPQTQQLPPQFTNPTPPAMPASMANGDASRPMSAAPTPDVGVGRGGGVPPPAPGFPAAPVAPAAAAGAMPHPNRSVPPPVAPSSLVTPPPGLPARPPPSQAGYGGPQAFVPPGFAGNSGQQPPFPPQAAPPPGFTPTGFGPPAGAPGPPPPLPPGFQQPGFGRGR